ncbi:MAG: SMP-30/gluconolactonase/LRE family protein, partial [Candidatus Aminicenantes bacterium]|nr:SMP-30/gluconolactonase/LRE family protein [Candidatus Aminicenantes bacterium]
SSFLGVVGTADSLYLPLQKGENELLLMVAEVMGGWGFLFQDAAAVVQGKGLTKAWETAKTFAVPESAAWDNTRNVFYVSNYDGYHRSRAEGQQTIARISPDGKIVEPRWLEGLFNPTGLAVHQDRLFAVERRAVAVIDIKNKKILSRIDLPGAIFPNDIAIDPAGTLYISDSAAHAIFRVTGETAEVWLQGGEIANPNGLCLLENELLVGNNGDRSLKAVAVASKQVRTVARFRSGIIDGIAVDGRGNILLSHNEGRLYRIGKDGISEKILDTTVIGTNLADFAFAAEKGLLVFPTFINNSLIAYHLKQD